MNNSPANFNAKAIETGSTDDAQLRAGAAILAGLAREADRRRDRHLRRVYIDALGDLAELRVQRMRGRLS